MTPAPLWMRALRWYALHSPVQCGAYRLALWLYQHLKIPDLETETTLDRTLLVSLRLPIWVDYNMYCLGLYEAPLARFFNRALRSDSIVVDVGAYVGQYTLLGAKRVPRGQVVALEPHPGSYARLQDHVIRNRLTNVTLVPKAAGRQSGRGSFFLREQAFTSGLCPPGGQTEPAGYAMATVEVVTADDLVEQLDLPRVDLMKIDVEGAERQVLQGAYEILTRFHPLLIVELNRERERAFGDTPEMLGLYLRDAGYALHTLKRQRLVPIGSSLPDYENVVAIPRTSTGHLMTSEGSRSGA